MKKWIVIQSIIWLLPITGFTQKVIMLPQELQANKPMMAAPKGIGTVSKYRFGPYEIVSGKAGWIKSKSKGRKPLFSYNYYEEETTSKQKLSFVFVANKKDTVWVNSAISSEVKIVEQLGITALQSSKQNFISEFQVSDSIVWDLVMTTAMGREIKDNYQVTGFATDGANKIKFTPVMRWADGSKPLMDMILGYTFYQDEKPIAAIQASGNTFHKKYVWIHEDLSPEMKVSVAAMAASLFIMQEIQMSEAETATD